MPVAGQAPARPFGLSVTIRHPAGTAPRPVDLLKPVFDGVIAAFHGHAGPADALEVVSERVARRLGLPAQQVRAWLVSRETAVLGDRVLVRPYRENVAWNPADERCLAGELLLDPVPGEWAISGALFAITPAAAGGGP